jgi:hypothetical protein
MNDKDLIRVPYKQLERLFDVTQMGAYFKVQRHPKRPNIQVIKRKSYAPRGEIVDLLATDMEEHDRLAAGLRAIIQNAKTADKVDPAGSQ